MKKSKKTKRKPNHIGYLLVKENETTQHPSLERISEYCELNSIKPNSILVYKLYESGAKKIVGLREYSFYAPKSNTYHWTMQDAVEADAPFMKKKEDDAEAPTVIEIPIRLTFLQKVGRFFKNLFNNERN